MGHEPVEATEALARAAKDMLQAYDRKRSIRPDCDKDEDVALWKLIGDVAGRMRRAMDEYEFQERIRLLNGGS